MASQTRQNYHQECEAGINKQINTELYASYVYQAVAFYFDRYDVALPGFHAFFKQLSDMEREDSEQLMKFQNQRGGRIVLQDIKSPKSDAWGSGVEACHTAMEIAKSLNQDIQDLHQKAERHQDYQMTDFLEGTFMHKESARIKTLGDYITNLTRVGQGLGEYMFDNETLQKE